MRESFGWFLGFGSWYVQVLLLVLYVGFSISGMRLVFRGSRDFLHVTLGKHRFAARVAGSLAALALLFSGVAVVVTFVAWFGGASPFATWDDPHGKGSAD